jgi:hypothetical protein
MVWWYEAEKEKVFFTKSLKADNSQWPRKMEEGCEELQAQIHDLLYNFW